VARDDSQPRLAAVTIEPAGGCQEAEVHLDRVAARRRFVVFGPLLGIGIHQAFCGLLYAWLRTAPPERASSILGYGVSLLVVYWIIADAWQRCCVPCFEFGYLVGIFLPFWLIW
jgi:hypothetical protein